MKQVLLALLLVILSAPAAADPFHYFIQVGAFRTEQDAVNQVAKLKEANNIPAVVSTREQGGRTIYRVRIGPFRDKSVSDSVKSQLEAIGLETALVRVEGQPNNATFLDNTIGRSSLGAQPAPPPSTRTQPPFSAAAPVPLESPGSWGIVQQQQKAQASPQGLPQVLAPQGPVAVTGPQRNPGRAAEWQGAESPRVAQGAFSTGEMCQALRQGLDLCSRQTPELNAFCSALQHQRELNNCERGPSIERQAQTEQAPRKLEREICDAMALKCGQDINSSDCRAFQASVRNNGYRCAVSPSQAAEKSPSSSAWGVCVVPTVQSQGTRNPSLTLNNNCPGLISWRYCVRVSGRNFADTPSGITQAGSSSSYRLMLGGQETYDWRHTWCAGRCDPEIPRC